MKGIFLSRNEKQGNGLKGFWKRVLYIEQEFKADLTPKMEGIMELVRFPEL